MNKNYLYIGIAIVVLIILYLVYQNAQDKKTIAAAQAAAAAAPVNYNSSGWLGQILNSQALSALVGGLAAGYSSGGTKG